MMTLGLDAGEEITLSANGEDEEAAMSSIEQYLEQPVKAAVKSEPKQMVTNV